MAFHHASASRSTQTDSLLSADNPRPDRFGLIDVLRRAAPALGLGPNVVATVDAMLSCLPPRRQHDIVFASNATLMARRNGITDRTLRRHFAELIAAGLLTRIASPNGKRYAKRSAAEARALCFGLDLAPLFAAFRRLQDLAAAKDVECERLAYLRVKLRAAIQRTEEQCGESALTVEARKALRRTLASADIERLLAKLDDVADLETGLQGDEMSGRNGQNVRHQQNSEKEITEKCDAEISPALITEACREAASYLPEPVRSPDDVIRHARKLAPMIAVDAATYGLAERVKGRFGAALTLWLILELGARIRQPAAYFRTLTSGRHKDSFCPVAALRGLAVRKGLLPDRCPRTILPTSALPT